jgi:hypothetical protein
MSLASNLEHGLERLGCTDDSRCEALLLVDNDTLTIFALDIVRPQQPRNGDSDRSTCDISSRAYPPTISEVARLLSFTEPALGDEFRGSVEECFVISHSDEQRDD